MKSVAHQAQLAGQVVYWRQWPRPDGRPVLALHCSLSHAAEWSGLAGSRPELAVYAPDLAGHGRMPVWDGIADLHGQSTDLARALAGHIGQGAPVDVIGHSFGGTVALRLALESPELVRRLVLVEPVIFAAARGNPAVWADYSAVHDRLMALHVKGDDLATLTAFQSLWGSGQASALSPQLQAYMLARIGLVMAMDPVLRSDALGLLTQGRPEALDRPVLLVEGADSPAVIGAIQAELARRLPKAGRVVVPGAAHMLPVTHAAELAQAVGAFLV